MKKVVIFQIAFEGNKKRGTITERMYYSIFTRKSKIINDFHVWMDKECPGGSFITFSNLIGI